MWFINLLTGGLLKTVLGFFTHWRDTEVVKWQTGVTADTTIITENIKAQVELNKLSAQLAIADKGWWVTAWMKPFVFYPFALHAVSVVFDSLPLLGHHIGSWGIPPLPGAYATMETTIIVSVIGVVGLKGVARIFTKGSA